MVINIPSESEASKATIISGFLIDEELETQSAEFPQLHQPPEIDAMERTRKPQKIPTPSSCPVSNPVQGIPVIPSEPSAWQLPRQRKRKVPSTLDEQGKAHDVEQGNDGGDEAWLP